MQFKSNWWIINWFDSFDCESNSCLDKKSETKKIEFVLVWTLWTFEI